MNASLQVAVKEHAPTWATKTDVIQNQKHNGIELRFNAPPSPLLQAKLRVSSFRPSKSQGMWYAAKTDETEAFAKSVQESFVHSMNGPELTVSPSFEPSKAAIEKKDFSYITVGLKNGETKNYIVFEPSKPKAEILATAFATAEFGDQLTDLVVKPRTNLREARILLNEQRIINALPPATSQSGKVQLDSPSQGLPWEPPELAFALWKKEDEKYPVDQIIIYGTKYHSARLREGIKEKLLHLPIEELIKLKNALTNEFEERRPLDMYEKGLVTIGKTGDKRKALVIAHYIDDMILDHDILRKSSGSLIRFLLDGGLFQQLTTQDKKGKEKGKKQNQLTRNQAIEALIDSLDQDQAPYREEDKELLRLYTGAGGLIKQGAEGRGILYEYYTSDSIIRKMWDLAYHFGYNGGKILEPSVGTGNFLKYAPVGAEIVGFETNHYAARIAQVLYPHAMIYEKAFETNFFAGNVHLKDDFGNSRYSLVIGNPPYGEFSGKYAGMGEKKFTGASQYEQYFTLRGLDLLEKDGLLVFILPSNFLKGQADQKISKKIAERCIGLDRYRLGEGVFKTTSIETDILVLKRK